jgi:hypothetical protein
MLINGLVVAMKPQEEDQWLQTNNQNLKVLEEKHSKLLDLNKK